MREGKSVAAVKLYQTTEKISHLRNVHEMAVIIVRAVTRPDFLSGFDISHGYINKIGIFANLLDRRVLQIGLYSVDLAWGEIDATDVTAMLFRVDIFVRVCLCPRAFGYGCDVMIALGLIVIRNKASTQFTDGFVLVDFHCRIQPVAGTGNF